MEQHVMGALCNLHNVPRCLLSLSKQGHVALPKFDKYAATLPSADIGPSSLGPIFLLISATLSLFESGCVSTAVGQLAEVATAHAIRQLVPEPSTNDHA